MNWKIITCSEDFLSAVVGWTGPVACDTETKGKCQDVAGRQLLGISLSPYNSNEAIYIPTLPGFNFATAMGAWLATRELVGHNFTYDKRWLSECLGYETNWIADTRIMWHLASAPAGPRPYGLKDAQKELLGWKETNEKELEDNVKAKGGKLRNGDHYLADLEVLAKYACLDAASTMAIYKHLLLFFEAHDYHPLLRSTMAYNELLEENTWVGVAVNEEALIKANRRLIRQMELYKAKVLKSLKPEITELELDWKDRQVAKYKREYNKTLYEASPDRWERFNMNSDSHKRELFYGKMGLPVRIETESGKPSTSADALKHSKHPAMEAYLAYEKANTLYTSFGRPYLDSVLNHRLHPGFNICGTVSYRLSGFKPYLLNAPFDEKAIMSALRCDEGHTGVHADLSAIEPTITAHYSEDPSLLKVFRDGLGDIYLDLALELFPTDKELHEGYNPRIPVDKATKERFSRQRKIAKTIQLAVQYTGTEWTVSRNLTNAGIETTPEEARVYVGAYWRKFAKVAQFNYRLKELNKAQGHLRNVIGRIIRVPDPEYKDLSNRFIQSSAHDVLILWVLEIYRLCKERGVHIKPVLLDCHDSTSNQVPDHQAVLVRDIYGEALENINSSLGLCVTIKADIKTFRTLAGLKGEET